MKETLYCIWMSDGVIHNIYAFNPLEAAILAMAEAVNSGANYTVDSVQNQETGQTYTISRLEASSTAPAKRWGE